MNEREDFRFGSLKRSQGKYNRLQKTSDVRQSQELYLDAAVSRLYMKALKPTVFELFQTNVEDWRDAIARRRAHV